jgi:hypothetical protein
MITNSIRKKERKKVYMNQKIPKTDFNPLLNEVILFRPLNDISRMKERLDGRLPSPYFLRYASNAWIPDDGQPDLAFIEGNMAYYVDLPYYTNLMWSWHTDGPHRWHYMTSNNKPCKDEYHWTGRDKHPNTLAGSQAMDKACSMHGSANGRGVHFQPDDPYILQGLVFIQRTDEKISIPEKLHCYDCENGREGHRRKELQKIKQGLDDSLEYEHERVAQLHKEIEDAEEGISRLEEAIRKHQEKIHQFNLRR